MPLGEYTAGPYTASHTPGGGSPASIGQTEEGWRVRCMKSERIERSDAYAQSLLDKVYLGIQGVLAATFLEWKDNELAMAFPWNPPIHLTATKLIVTNAAKPIARLASDVAGSLVLTAVASTPAASRGPATWTGGKLIIQDDSDIEILMGPNHRKIAVTFDLLLYLSTSDYILYSAT